MAASSTQEGYVPVPGGRAWYRRTEYSRGIPLLMLQGGPGTSQGYFEPLVALSEDREVVLYASLDEDAAASAAVDQWTCAHHAETLRQVRTSLGLTRVHLLGYGWGALAALEYALSQPEGLVSLVVDPVDPAALIRYICQSLQSQVMQAPHMNPRTAQRLARLSEIAVPTLLIWEEAAARESDLSRCESRLLPGWELAVLRNGIGGPDSEERFTRAVRRFLAHVEDGDARIDPRTSD
jgi:hypothetical protein